MDEAKAAAYYDELTRKGSGAARFKQGLGFSSTDDSSAPWKPSSSSSSFYSNFVRASTTGEQSSEPAEKKQQQVSIRAIQEKLKRKLRSPSPSRYDHEGRSRRGSSSRELDLTRDRDRHERGSRDRLERGSRDRRRSRSRERTHSNSPKRQPRSRSREIGRGAGRREDYRKRRSRSRSGSHEAEERRRRGISSDDGNREYTRRGSSRSRSPNRSPDSRSRRGESRREKGGNRPLCSSKDRNRIVDYSQMIQGYDKMSPAERVKAKMKLQLSQAADKDMAIGANMKWERFDFNDEAPLDDEEEIEAAEDDSLLVKGMKQSFRFSAVEAKREDEIKAAHDHSMFGVPSALPVSPEELPAQEVDSNQSINDALISDTLASTMQQGSWRDRVRRIQDTSKADS